MDRRFFLLGSSSLSLSLLSGCSLIFGEDPDLELMEPLQVNHEAFEISPRITSLATFSAKVLVLLTKDYPQVVSDPLSFASPIDIAVAWGDAAKRVSRQSISLSQADRRYRWVARERDMKKPGVGNFTRHSGNWHMIPENEDIASRLEQLKRNQIVFIEGELVEVRLDNGIFYRSSTSRDDTGDSACEIIYVSEVSVIGEVEEISPEGYFPSPDA